MSKKKEKLQAEFIDHIKSMIHYWDNQDKSSRDKLEGLAFSIMMVIDGETHLPAFILAPCNENRKIAIKCDIAENGDLHEKLLK